MHEAGMEDAAEDGSFDSITEELIAEVIKASENEREDRHGQDAVAIARLAGFFDDGEQVFKPKESKGGHVAEGPDYANLERWKEELSCTKKGTDSVVVEPEEDTNGGKRSKKKRKGKGRADIMKLAELRKREKLGIEDALLYFNDRSFSHGSRRTLK